MTRDEAFTRVQAHCLAKDGAYEDYPWGDTVWKIAPKGKMFCGSGGDPLTVGVKSTLEKQSALIQHPHIRVADYVGRYGWVSISVVDNETLDLALDLIDESYDMIAPKPKKAGGKRG